MSCLKSKELTLKFNVNLKVQYCTQTKLLVFSFYKRPTETIL